MRLNRLILVAPFILKCFADSSASHSGVDVLSTDNFKDRLSQNSHFVMFYAPWCGHCRNLQPTWDELAREYNTELSSVKIAKVDCTQYTSLCTQNEVISYPTLKLFPVGQEDGIKFKGARDIESMKSFINENLELEKKELENKKSPSENYSSFEHSEESFSSTSSGNHFVKFYAPWCGHCQRLAPTWESLAEAYGEEKFVSISKLDCTKYRSICLNHDIQGYPTLLWFSGGKVVSKYSGNRSLGDLKSFVDGEIAKTKTLEKGPVVELSNLDLSGITLVQFYAPWCGHCKRLYITYKDLANQFADNSEVTIARLDCTLEANRDLCIEEKIDRFPTLILFKGKQRIAHYNGDRSLEDLSKFVKSNIVHDEL